jgi:hypothetical protein
MPHDSCFNLPPRSSRRWADDLGGSPIRCQRYNPSRELPRVSKKQPTRLKKRLVLSFQALHFTTRYCAPGLPGSSAPSRVFDLRRSLRSHVLAKPTISTPADCPVGVGDGGDVGLCRPENAADRPHGRTPADLAAPADADRRSPGNQSRGSARTHGLGIPPCSCDGVERWLLVSSGGRASAADRGTVAVAA